MEWKDHAENPRTSVVHEPARATKMLESARVRLKEMLLTEFLDDIVSTVVSFRMVVVDREVAAGGWEMLRSLFEGRDLAMGKSRNR